LSWFECNTTLAKHVADNYKTLCEKEALADAAPPGERVPGRARETSPLPRGAGLEAVGTIVVLQFAAIPGFAAPLWMLCALMILLALGFGASLERERIGAASPTMFRARFTASRAVQMAV
jgi:hypothetical protein